MTTKGNNSSVEFKMLSGETAIMWLAAFAVEGFFIVLLNILTIATLVLNSRLRRRVLYCVINLAVADLLHGVLGSACQILNFVVYLNDPNSKSDMLHNIMTAAVFAVTLSLLALVVVSLERFLATYFPLRYRNTKLKMYIVVFAFTWFLALLDSLLFYFAQHLEDNSVSVVFIFLNILSLALIMTSYSAIYIKMKLQNQVNHQQHQQVQGNIVQRRRHDERERHLVMTLFIVTVLSLSTWIPYITVRVMFSYDKTFDQLFSTIPNIVSIAFLIQGSNSLINPVVYVFRMKDFRKALYNLVFKCSRYRTEIRPVGNDRNQQTTNSPAIALRHFPNLTCTVLNLVVKSGFIDKIKK